MAKVAHGVSAQDLRAAAEYFSALEPVSHSRVVEAARVPRAVEFAFVQRFLPGPRVPVGQRIVEGPDDMTAHELRDPNEHYTAWVPPRSLARGRRLVEHGAPGVPACVSCHTADLVGIGGASPTMLARQLFGFRSHARNDPGAAPMQAVAGGMTDAQIIAAAAYVGAHRPWTRAQMQGSLLDEH
jgi:cytochrome c553